jgi:hypothetical protein
MPMVRVSETIGPVTAFPAFNACFTLFVCTELLAS